jgi:hypothetical protein
MSGISYFRHKNTPRRLMAMIRSHSSSVVFAAGLTSCSAPALLKATSRRPNASTACWSAACTSSERVTSQRTATARPPDCSIKLAVSWLASSARSATTTLALARANASAAAWPMPLAAPVTNATLPAKLPSWLPAAIMCSFASFMRVTGAAAP